MKKGIDNPKLVAEVKRVVFSQYTLAEEDFLKGRSPEARALVTHVLKECGLNLKSIKEATGITYDGGIYTQCEKAKKWLKTPEFKVKCDEARAAAVAVAVASEDDPAGTGDLTQRKRGGRKGRGRRKSSAQPESEEGSFGEIERLVRKFPTARILLSSDPAVAARTARSVAVFVLWNDKGWSVDKIAATAGLLPEAVYGAIGEIVVLRRSLDGFVSEMLKIARA